MTTAAPPTKTIDVAGKSTQLTVGGDGPPLMYLHSAGGETDWMPFHELLAKKFTVYLPAHPGFADSEGLDEIEDMEDLVWHYVDLLDALHLASVPVVGFSLGAWLGTELAIHRPARVEKLVLTDAAGLHVPDAPMTELFIDDLDVLRERLFHDPQGPNVELGMPTSLEDSRIIQWLKAREATARVGWNPYLHNPRLPRHLKRVECPTLVVWGRHDKLIPLAHGEFYAEHIPGAKLEILESSGHMAPFEQPQQWADLVTAFVGG
jgi:pimeloyl-ACP methyl ester carboxylesterase